MEEYKWRAHAAWKVLDALGYSQAKIAVRLDIDPSSLCRINALREDSRGPKEEFYISRRVAEKLEGFIPVACMERFEVVAPYLSMSILDTCNDADKDLREEDRPGVLRRVVQSFMRAFKAQLPPVSLPEEVAAVLVAVTEDLYVVKLQPYSGDDAAEGKANHTRLLIHELEHLIQRLRQTLPRPKRGNQSRGEF